MAYRYLVLPSNCPAPEQLGDPDIAKALAKHGLEEHRACRDQLRLFTSQQTPTLQAPGGAFVIGHLCSRDGTLINRSSQFPVDINGSSLRRHILTECWGEYVLIQPMEDGYPRVSIMRSPSPAGGCPCIYSSQPGSQFVASHVSLAIVAGLYIREVDWDFVIHRMMYPDVKTRSTGLANVRELLPGCWITLDERQCQAGLAWSPWDFVSTKRRHVEQQAALDDVRQAISMVVTTLGNIDRTALLELSGGLDSSIVGICLKDSRASVTCTSLLSGTPGTDERSYARLVSNHLGVDLHAEKLLVEDACHAFTLHPDILSARVGPLQFAINESMEAAADYHSASSFYSGGGGDIVFCYLRTAAPAADAFRECGVRSGISAIQNLSILHRCTLWNATRLTLKKLALKPRPLAKPDRSFLAPDLMIELKSHPWLSEPDGAFVGDRERIFGLTTAQVYQDSVPRSLHRHVRLPLLSQPVVEACLRSPSWMWISHGMNRTVARMAYADKLPEQILRRTSKGTFTSYMGAVYSRSRKQIRSHLLYGELATHGFLDTDSVQSFFNSNPSSRDPAFARIFDLCMVENWVRNQNTASAP